MGWHNDASSLIGSTDRLEGLTCPVDGLAAEAKHALSSIAKEAIRERRTVASPITAERTVAIGVPVGSASSLVAICDDTDERDNVARRTAVDLAGAKISHWLLAAESRQGFQDSQHVAALVDLTSRILECDGADAAHRRVVDELQNYLDASSVILGICRDETTVCRLAVSSDVADLNQFSDSTRIAEAALQESVARSAASIWPTSDSNNRHALLAHQQFADDVGADSVVGCPLRTAEGKNVGAIVVTFKGELTSTDAGKPIAVPPEDRISPATIALNFLRAGEQSIANAVHLQNRSINSLTKLIRNAVRRTFTTKLARTVAIVVAVVAAVLLIPMDYRVPCDLELQPVARRFVAAPFAAPLETCFVEPGDVVAENEILAQLDGRELKWELAGIRADLGKAGKEYNTHLSEQEYGLAAIARHEIDRLENRAALLSAREENLEIRSPMAGVVVAGDLRDTEGVPLETGQSLFEVAPLDRMVVEIEIPEEDIRHVRRNMSLTFYLNAMPGESFKATVLRIHPRAELREQDNVFVAEAELENTSAVLRPGMKGEAKVSTGVRPIGWNLFHKPVAHVTGWLGW
ncbi:MAG: efflux RND transporter periplasmic adaptor subunit [Fuerstiella sp.]|nr:efflux RND transporter periplasmic adaptor subunit [Fuerstiella sp.]MCP4855706.1 efflux RND transporter periplasmic adaptor subunit [Fuerstiella sp.]